MRVKTDTSKFMKDMQNVIDYSIGFIDGAKSGHKKMLQNLGEKTLEILNAYIDSNARVDPSILQHVYEWEMSGSPSGRLFDLRYIVKDNGISVNYTFRQSTTVKAGSRVPFYDKARIMEDGIPVTIVPKATVLVFEDNGETVFTKKPVVVENPGGPEANGGFQQTINNFFNNYFSQAFLNSSGLLKHLSVPMEYNISESKGGNNSGRRSGYRWITKEMG